MCALFDFFAFLYIEYNEEVPCQHTSKNLSLITTSIHLNLTKKEF